MLMTEDNGERDRLELGLRKYAMESETHERLITLRRRLGWSHVSNDDARVKKPS